jgi:hypothetical protein
MNWKYLKSKQFLFTWLLLYLLIPTFWLHTLVATYEAERSIYPFAGGRWIVAFFDQLFAGDFGDAFISVLAFQILPLLVYTFVLSFLMHYVFLKLKNRQKARLY